MSHDDAATEVSWEELLGEPDDRRESGFRQRVHPASRASSADISGLERLYQRLEDARSEWFSLESVAEERTELPRCETARPGAPLTGRWFSLVPTDKTGMRQSTSPETRDRPSRRHRSTADFEAPNADVIALDAARRRRGTRT